jgi:SHS2 domain-containing protein
MAKHCETFDHTADVGLLARADTLGTLMEALAEGLSDVICDRTGVAPGERREVTVQAEDIDFLAVDFLSEILLAFEVDHFLLAEAEVRQVSRTSLSAGLVGEQYDGDRHELRNEVKAVTYHELKVAREGDQWVGRVILDL